MSYDNTNKGALWGNREKKKDTHPDFKGSLNVNGVEYWVSAWRRGEDSKPNAPALKLSIEPKQKAVAKSADQVVMQPEPSAFPDDEIPF